VEIPSDKFWRETDNVLLSHDANFPNCFLLSVIVPNKKSVIQAGAPPNVNAIGQQVPLFACMEIAQENESGRPVLPLFLELDDANDAVTQAVSFDGGREEDFEVVCLNLSEAVSQLANAKEDQNAFHFVPPASSLEHIRDYLSGEKERVYK
jgi:hypothetical protein